MIVNMIACVVAFILGCIFTLFTGFIILFAAVAAMNCKDEMSKEDWHGLD